jgi:hopanoid biosynthesis associated RND transporter like protein HpnN
MLAAAIVRIVDVCVRRPWPVIAAAVLLAVASALYAGTHFRINTDAESLLPTDLPWRQDQVAYETAFPQTRILAVLQGPSPEMAEIAAERLAARLQQRSDLFSAVRLPQGGIFAERNALLFAPLPSVMRAISQLTAEKPIIDVLAADPTLRGVMHALSAATQAIEHRRMAAAALLGPTTQIADALDDLFAGRFATVSWRALVVPGAGGSGKLSLAFVAVEPKLDFAALQPGHAATTAIRQTADELQLAAEFGVTVRLTGRVPIADAQFSSLSEDAIPGLLATVAVVLLLLWLALRSPRIIVAGFVTLVASFAVTAAAGLLMVGAFNLISIAFAILFVGLGADFAIQFSVRYRAERHDRDEVAAALQEAAAKAGLPLALAAASTAVGFLCFMPTEYRGIGELGEIAGVGMLIAFAATITLLPALLVVLNPPGEPRRMGFTTMAPVDRFLARHRIAVVVGTIVVVFAGAPLLLWMRFDFDPIHLQDQKSEAVAAYQQLGSHLELGIDAINIVVPSTADVGGLQQRLQALPEVLGTRSVQDLVPPDQGPKLDAIRKAAGTLGKSWDARDTRPRPSDADLVRALHDTAGDLRHFAAAPEAGESGPAASRLAGLLDRLAAAAPELREHAQTAIVVPLRRDLIQLRRMFDPENVTLATLPPTLARDWMAPDGRARVEVLSKGDPSDTASLRRLARAVLGVAPHATGSPVELLRSQQLVVNAFIQAGALAIVAIGVILWIALRRFGDVLLTLVPLLVAAAVTLEVTVLIGEPLNFANVIALPLLLGVGVAFKIYYIMAWRSGRTNLLQSTLTRAVFFSALTTATSFGSLWLSRQPGMSSMGKLMVVALLCTLAAAVLFQPALMGPPRQHPRRALLSDEPEDEMRRREPQPSDLELTRGPLSPTGPRAPR